jgi:hypothetical protein
LVTGPQPRSRHGLDGDVACAAAFTPPRKPASYDEAIEHPQRSDTVEPGGLAHVRIGYRTSFCQRFHE